MARLHWLYDPSLVLWLPFKEGSGTTVGDLSGYGNNGTIYGATWQMINKKGWGLSFDGEDDWMDVSDSPSLRIGDSNATWEVWVKINTENYYWIFDKEITWAANSSEYELNTYIDPFRLIFRFYGVAHHAFSFGAPPLGEWFHAVVVKKGTVFAGYIDLEQKIQEDAGEHLPITTSDLWFGKLKPDRYHFDGLIDVARIYKRALSEEEIRILYEYERKVRMLEEISNLRPAYLTPTF